MSTIKDGGSAFPVPGLSGLPNGEFIQPYGGMTLREYSAIKLRVPDSGTDWLDDMIRQSLRDELAKAALSTVGGYSSEDLATWTPDHFANHAYAIADAMLKRRDDHVGE